MAARKRRHVSESTDSDAPETVVESQAPAEAPTPRRRNSGPAIQRSAPVDVARLHEATGVPIKTEERNKIDPKKLAEATGVPLNASAAPKKQRRSAKRKK